MKKNKQYLNLKLIKDIRVLTGNNNQIIKGVINKNG
jgi:hypothetical protein